MTALLQLQDLSVSYGQVEAVHQVHLDVNEGEIVTVIGPNGAGKTTTMRIMVGLTPASTGEATILDRHFSELPNPGREVGVLLRPLPEGFDVVHHHIVSGIRGDGTGPPCCPGRRSWNRSARGGCSCTAGCRPRGCR